MLQLLHGELRENFLRRIAQMPHLRPVSTGRIIMPSPSPPAASRRTFCAAIRRLPTRNGDLASSFIWPRIAQKQAAREMASVGCPPDPLPRLSSFLALYGLLTDEASVLFTIQPGVPDRLVGVFCEPPWLASWNFFATS